MTQTEPEPEELAPDEDDYLPRDEVVANLRDYVDCIEIETQIIEAATDKLEAGEIAVEELVETLPDPMPLEAWDRGEFDTETDYSLKTEADGGE